MKLRELLNIISVTANEIKASKPYLVGGMVRDIMLKRFGEISDIDITCGDATSDTLGQALLKKVPEATYTKFSDGHGCLSFEQFKVDFSNNFHVPNVGNQLKQLGIARPSDMESEIYSRDFTINALLMPLDLSKVYDITNRGVKDIQAKRIDTCLDPEITFRADPRRIIRVVYLGAKLGFNPSERVATWVAKNEQLVSTIDRKYLTDKMDKALEKNPKAAIDIIEQLNLKKYVPNSEAYRNFIVDEPELLYRSLNE